MLKEKVEGTRLKCIIKTRGLEKGQQCEFVGGNDLVYQVYPLRNGKRVTEKPIDVPNYSVVLYEGGLFDKIKFM